MIWLTVENLDRSVRNSENFTALASDPPAARATASRFAKACRTWGSNSALTISPVLGSRPICPEVNTTRPVLTACEYGPIAAGAAGVETISLFMAAPSAQYTEGGESSRQTQRSCCVRSEVSLGALAGELLELH